MNVQILKKEGLTNNKLKEIFENHKPKTQKMNNKYLLNRYAQIGRILKYKNIIFQIVQGEGFIKHLKTNRQMVGATISDFVSWCEEYYNCDPTL